MKNLLLRRAVIALLLAVSLSAGSRQLVAQGFGGGGGGRGNNNASRNSSSSSYPSATQMGTATVSVDPETRRVFVVTDEETAEYVAKVIKDLDRSPPQVLIKCIFMEALYSKDLEVGVDGTYTHTISGDGTGLANTAFGAVSGGGTYALLTKDLRITLTALARAGKTEILSRPSILARNNQPATISIGKQVPLITNTRFDNYGNQINSISYQNIGIILHVTPFITSDKMVEMVVAPSTSELADQSQWVPVSSGGTNAGGSFSAPVINSRSADTVVVVPDGQTVVIGGLMQTQKFDAVKKVPLLGDIPLLGFFFRKTTTSSGKAELLIFLTPHIVNFPSELAAYSDKEQAVSEILPKAFNEQEVNRYLNDIPATNKAGANAIKATN